MFDHERHHDPHQRRKRTIERAGPWRGPEDPCVGRPRWRPVRSAEGWQRVSSKTTSPGTPFQACNHDRAAHPA